MIALIASLAWGAPSETAISASLVVAVSQKDVAADALVAWSRAHGGWFQERTAEHVSLRVPSELAEDLTAFASEQGKVVDRALSRDDVSRELADARGRLEAREKVLDQYYAVLATAKAGSVVEVERQIVWAIEEIERLKGRIRLLEDQARWARVDVSFQFRDRSAPARDGSSSFRWLNTLNVQDVVYGMRQSRPSWKTKGVSVPEPPAGFSAWRKHGRYRAASPQDVMLRVRTEKHKPKAELAFWKEAVRERMVAAGYTLVAESDIEAGGVKGGLVELAAPMGTDDWTYLIAFFPNGGRIVVAEAAGEVATFAEVRDELEASIRAMSF